MSRLTCDYNHYPENDFPHHFREIVSYINAAELRVAEQQWALAIAWCETQFGPNAEEIEDEIAKLDAPWAGRIHDRKCNWIIFRHEVDAAAFRLVWG